MLHAVLIFVVFQAAGELIANVLSLPVPGMVIGLVLLLACLGVRGRWLGAERAVPDGLMATAKGLHNHLGLLFVPAGAGIVANFGTFATNGAALLAAVLVSTVSTIAVTALVAAGQRREIGAAAAVPVE